MMYVSRSGIYSSQQYDGLKKPGGRSGYANIGKLVIYYQVMRTSNHGDIMGIYNQNMCVTWV